MKILLPILCVMVAGLALTGCNTAEKYARNNSATTQWLDANVGKPAIDISGSWHSDDWGGAYFTQSGNRITGHLGKFPVVGVVRGGRAYLAISESGWTYYTAILQMPSRNHLTGFYSYSVPFSTADQRILELVRTGPNHGRKPSP